MLLGGTLKIAYDLLLFRNFRHIKAPEELARNPAGLSAG